MAKKKEAISRVAELDYDSLRGDMLGYLIKKTTSTLRSVSIP